MSITKLTNTSSWTKRTLPIWDSSRVYQPRMIKLRARHETIRRRPCRAGSKRGGRKRTQARCAHGRMGDLASRTEDKLPGDRTQKDERHGHGTPAGAAPGRNRAATATSGELSRQVNGNPMPSREPNPRALAGALAFHARGSWPGRRDRAAALRRTPATDQ